jgi:hypothetical protein
VIEMSKNEDQTSPIFTAVRSTGVLRKNERAIDRILRVLVIKTTVTEDDLEAVQNILDSNITIRRAGGSTEILSVASAFGCNDLFIRVYLAISPRTTSKRSRTFSTQTSRSAARAAAPRSSRSRVPSAATICSSACTLRFRRRAWSPRPW